MSAIGSSEVIVISGEKQKAASSDSRSEGTELVVEQLLDLPALKLRQGNVRFVFPYGIEYQPTFESTTAKPPVQSYQVSLLNRGLQFCAAAKRYIELTGNDAKKLNQIKILQEVFKRNVTKDSSESTAQAFFTQLMGKLKKIVPEKMLSEAESLCNVQEQPTIVTVIPDQKGYNLSIARPKNTFKDLTREQQLEFLIAYFNQYPEELKTQQPNEMVDKQMLEALSTSPREKKPKDSRASSPLKAPAWFEHWLPWKKTDLCKQLKKVLDGENVAITTPTTLRDRPGLSGTFISQTAKIRVDKEQYELAYLSKPSIRSSALRKEGADAAKIVQQNIQQTLELHNKSDAPKDHAAAWPAKKARSTIVFCQSLVKPAMGGDYGIQGAKNKALQNLQKQEKDKKPEEQYYFTGSNHNVTTNSVFKVFIRLFELPSKNKNREDMALAVSSFLQYDVAPNYPSEKEFLKIYFKDAKNGKFVPPKLTPKCFKDKEPQYKSLILVLTALSDYNKESNFWRPRPRLNDGLYLASLEEIIITETGNVFQSACKSGKDREALQKTYVAAMLEYFHRNNRLPTLFDSEDQRAEFNDIFIRILFSNHHALLAEMHSQGACGLKSLKSVLPSDIYQEIENRGFAKLLKLYDKSGEINKSTKDQAGTSKEEYRAAKNAFNLALAQASSAQTVEPAKTSLAQVSIATSTTGIPGAIDGLKKAIATGTDASITGSSPSHAEPSLTDTPVKELHDDHVHDKSHDDHAHKTVSPVVSS